MKGAALLAGLLTCFGSVALAQTTPACQPFTTDASSNAWLTEVSRQPLPQQVAAVRERAICDANVRDPSRDPKLCFTSVSAENQRIYARREAERRLADTRPVGATLLYIVDGRTLLADLVAHLRQLVTVGSVKAISFLHETAETAIYGTRGASGVVVITTKKRQH